MLKKVPLLYYSHDFRYRILMAFYFFFWPVSKHKILQSLENSDMNNILYTHQPVETRAYELRFSFSREPSVVYLWLAPAMRRHSPIQGPLKFTHTVQLTMWSMRWVWCFSFCYVWAGSDQPHCLPGTSVLMLELAVLNQQKRHFYMSISRPLRQ